MVDERPEIDATIITSSSCSQDSSGTATVRPSVSGTRYVLNWSGGREINDSTVVDLPPGNYGVIVIDQLNCSKRFTFTISESSTSQLAYQIKNDSCSEDGIDLLLQKKMTGRLTGNNVDQNGSDFLNLASGLYQLSVFDSNGCFVKDTMLLLSNPATYSFQIQDTIIIDFGQVAMTPILGDTSEISSIQWANDEGIICLDCPFLNAQPNQTTSYQVTIIDSNGCLHTLTVVVIVEGGFDVFVPNIFSPNGDNINDKLRIFSSFDNLTITDFQIFSRWGELIYQETEKSLGDFQGWNGSFNGQLVNPGVFVYRLTYSAVGIKSEMLTGSVTVYR